MPKLIAIYQTSASRGHSVTIGRGEGHGICVFDPWVSRQGHARIMRNEEGFYELHDLGSRNGTYVNGTRVREPVVLNDGDTIRCGNSIFVFEDDGTDATGVLTEETIAQASKLFAPPTREAFARCMVPNYVKSEFKTKHGG